MKILLTPLAIKPISSIARRPYLSANAPPTIPPIIPPAENTANMNPTWVIPTLKCAVTYNAKKGNIKKTPNLSMKVESTNTLNVLGYSL